MMRRRQRSHGSVILLVALGIIVFFAFLAIVLDFGRMFLVKQELHNHCDAAALAGAQNLPDPDLSIDRAALYYATNVHTEFQDGMWQSDSGNTSTFLIPPVAMKNWRHKEGDWVDITTPFEDEKTIAHHLAPSHVIEVISTREVIHFLGQLMGKPTVRLRARAVAYKYYTGVGDDDDDDAGSGDDDDDDLWGDDDDVWGDDDDDGWGGDDDDDDDSYGEGCCEGKATQLTLRYDGANAADVMVTQKGGEIVYNNTVDPGQQFTFVGVDNKGTLGTEITIYVNDAEHTKIHTSCSQPLGPGLKAGDFMVVAGYSRTGGPLCAIGDVGEGGGFDDGSGDDGGTGSGTGTVTTRSFETALLK